MALTEDGLQGKRNAAADLQRQIDEEKQKRSSLVAEKERESQGEVLDIEIERLRNELEVERALTSHQESANQGVTGSGFLVIADSDGEHVLPGETPDPAPVAPPTTPVTDKATKGTTQKENS